MDWSEAFLFLAILLACMLNSISTAKLKMDLHELERKLSMHEYEHFSANKEAKE